MKNAIKIISFKLYEKAIEDDIFSSTAQVAFYFSFSIFPLLLFAIGLFGIFLDLDTNGQFKQNLYSYLFQIMPFSAYELVKTTVEEASNNSTSGKVTLGLFIALWSASAGVDTLRISLNRVYKFNETRSWWFTRLLSVIFTIVLTLLIGLALSLVFYGSKLLENAGLPENSHYLTNFVQWVIVLVLLLIIFELLYNVLPDRKPFRWFWITPGAIVGIILWLLLSNGLKTYLQYYNTYDRIYGSIGAVIILMLWLYLTAMVILIGGMINAILRELIENKCLELTQIEKLDSSDILEKKTE
jgi:membrane protein